MRIGTRETVRRIAVALNRRDPFSLIRLADGEMRAIASMTTGRLPDGRSRRLGRRAEREAAAHFEPFLAGLQKADVFGLPFSGGGTRYYKELIERVSPLVDMEAKALCDACINAFMVIGGQLWGLVVGRRVLIMNDQSDAIVDAVQRNYYSPQCWYYGIGEYPGWDIVATVRTDCKPDPGDEQYESKTPPPKWRPVQQYIDEAAAYDFDIALVGFGWRAVAVCPLLAEKTGKVVLDMGSVLRELWFERTHWHHASSWGGLEERAPAALEC